MNKLRPLRPRARQDGIVVQDFPKEVLVYDLDRHQVHCLNPTSAFVFRHCDGRRAADQIARLLAEELGTPVAPEVVTLALAQLAETHLLDGDQLPAAPGISRRDVIKRAGLAAALLPVITSILAPTAAQAATCLPSGSGCTSGAQCCSGICSASTCV